MINQFRTLTPLNLFFLVPFAVLLCLGAFANLPAGLRPVIFEPAISNLISPVHGPNISPYLNVFVAVGLTFLQALYLNQVVNKYNLLGRSTFLPALLYIALASMLTSFLVISPTLICNFLLIGMIDKFLSIYFRTDCKSVLFDLGIIVAIATLFYLPFIALFPTLWISLLIFKPFNWREWLTSLIGFTTVYFILFVIYFWLGRTVEFKSIWLPLTQPYPSSLKQDFHDYLVLIIPAVILVLFGFSLRKNFYKSMVHIRKSFELLFFVFLFGIASFYLSHDFQEYHFLLCVPPIAIYMAYYFNYAQTKWVYEGLFALMLISFIYFQWF